MLTLELLKRAAKGGLNVGNANSFLIAYAAYADKFGLDKPHRAAQLGAQLLHESGCFRYDKEIWGPTPAQERYDTRTDLGNTKAKDGDGKKYLGRGAIQITGKANYEEYRDWCRKNIDKNAPDFVASPDLVNTDPWEGLVPIWYWDTRGINKFADLGDVEMVTKRINGGTNGFDDRVDYLVRLSLAMLGRPVNGLRDFQKDKGLVVDGEAGPKTRAALHEALVKLTPGEMKKDSVQVAPVMETKEVLPTQVKKDLDKPIVQSRGLWERLGVITTALASMSGAAWLQDWKVILALGSVIIVFSLIGLFFHKKLLDAVRASGE